MKIFKKVLIVLGAFIALVLILALFMDRKYTIEREITINKPENEVFAYIKQIRNQDYYSKWNMADPNKKTEMTGTDGTVGFVYKWDGNDDVGAGEQEITGIKEGERIDMALRFKRPWEGTANTYMATTPVSGSSTKVTWAMYGESSYPMNFMNFIMDGMLGDDLQTGLNNLKNVLEKQ